MSNLRVGTLSNIAGTGSPDIVGGELARARLNLNGTGTIAARDSFNCSSFVDNAVGDYTASFAVAFPAADWSAASAGWGGSILSVSGAAAPTAGAMRLYAAVNGGAALDPDYVRAVAFGDKP